MKLKTNKQDNTRNERQARRRVREKQWLKENGWQSWEALHTALMNGTSSLTLDVTNVRQAPNNKQVSGTRNR